MTNKLRLHFFDESLTLYRFEPGSDLPESIWDRAFCSVTKTQNEISVVVSGVLDIDSEYCSANWTAFFVEGPLPHNMVGVMAELSKCIASVGCSIFAIATFDTDYILIAEDKLDIVKNALEQAGHTIVTDKG